MSNFCRYILLMGLFSAFSQGCSGQDGKGRTDRLPAVAGRFYPADPKDLQSVLSGFFSEAVPPSGGDVAAIVVPHAGYVFSGGVAACGYNQVDTTRLFDNVFLIASSHQVSFRGASVYTSGDYVTPFGKVKVNTELALNLIRDNKIFCFNAEADRSEHSTEVQVPFLQHHLKPGFKLVPIVIGSQAAEDSREIARALLPYFNNRNLFVISSDFSHYPAYEDAKAADKATCEAILSGSAERLLSTLARFREKPIPNLATNLCGWTSVLVLLYLGEARPPLTYRALRYKNSGDSPYGDKEQVVGYWSISATRADRQDDFNLTPDEKHELLRIARNTLEYYLKNRRIPDPDSSKFLPGLNRLAGAFVTLRENGELRGCIGRFTSDLPLHRLVREMAVAAATEDSRFQPVTPQELSNISIEISVLTPLHKIKGPDEIDLGRDGIYIKKGYASGTFLPQVATETGWSLEEFLGHCSRDKAGLGWDGWKSAELFTYQAIVFSEGD